MRPKKLKKFTISLWFEHKNCLKIIEWQKKYHTGLLGVIPITRLGFMAQILGFCVRISTALEKEPPRGFVSNSAEFYTLGGENVLISFW